jgi:NADH-quinone oxidoreductase subunit J
MSIGNVIVTMLVVVLGATGTFLMLPHRQGAPLSRAARGVGAALAGCGLLVFLTLLSPPGLVVSTAFFYLFSAAALIGAVLTVTSRDPIFSALWFASVVLSTAGLFALAGAPFLAAGTVIVYAGAIIVTFLFVIMLAQMEGKAPYDRASRSPGAATFTCFLVFWCLVYAIVALGRPPVDELRDKKKPPVAVAGGFKRGHDLAAADYVVKEMSPAPVLERALPPALLLHDQNGQDKPNVAGLGESLYTTHLITATMAGALLFVALIGAVAIANPRPPVRPVRSG